MMKKSTSLWLSFFKQRILNPSADPQLRETLTNELLLEVLSSLVRLESQFQSTIVSSAPPNPTGFMAQRKIVSSAGTAVRLPSVEIPPDFAVVIKALNTNQGIIYIGNSKAAAENTFTSFPLMAGQGISYKVDNVNRIWVSSDISDDGVAWTVEIL